MPGTRVGSLGPSSSRAVAMLPRLVPRPTVLKLGRTERRALGKGTDE